MDLAVPRGTLRLYVWIKRFFLFITVQATGTMIIVYPDALEENLEAWKNKI